MPAMDQLSLIATGARVNQIMQMAMSTVLSLFTSQRPILERESGTMDSALGPCSLPVKDPGLVSVNSGSLE